MKWGFWKKKPPHPLLRYLESGRELQFFVGVPTARPRRWERLNEVSGTELICGDQTVSLDDVTAFAIAYPSGEILCLEGEVPELPDGTHMKQPVKRRVRATIALEELESGRDYAEVAFGRAETRSDGREMYSTTLRNRSDVPIKIVKFGAFRRARGPKGDEYQLSTITKDFFTAEDFRQWYGLRSEWIEPGGSACDPDNYGPDSLWAYYGVTKNGVEFVAGGVSPRARKTR